MFAEKAYIELFGQQDCPYKIELKYSGKFSGYNANVKMQGKKISFNLSSAWKGVDEEIQIGLLQSLLCKIFKKKTETMNIKLYHGFLKNIHVALPKKDCEPELLESFNTVNERFFSGSMDISSIQWGNESTRLFGSYDYGTDTIKLNPLLSGKKHLLDYVMFHEMLHKRHKFSSSCTRTFHHTPAFRKEENMYPGKKELEKELSGLTKNRKRLTKLFHWF